MRRSKLTLACWLLALSLVLAACGKGPGNSGSTAAPAAEPAPTETAPVSNYPEKALEFIAPSGAGGGWDTTARTAGKVLNEQGIIARPIIVQNKPGGGGAVGLSYLVEQKGSGYTINVYSPPLLLINLNGQTPLSYRDTTPLAQVMVDYLAYVVPADSTYQTIGDLMEQAKQDPQSVKLGGGSAPGSMDHLGFVLAAKAAGVDVKNLPYVSFQGGGEAMTNLLGGHVDVITTDISGAVEQVRAGAVRVLAVTASERVAALPDVPTLKESGINAEFPVWRGFFGPPDMPADAVRYMEEAFAKMLETQAWKDEAANRGWLIAYKNSADFKQFLAEQNQAMEALLSDLGLLKK